MNFSDRGTVKIPRSGGTFFRFSHDTYRGPFRYKFQVVTYFIEVLTRNYIRIYFIFSRLNGGIIVAINRFIYNGHNFCVVFNFAEIQLIEHNPPREFIYPPTNLYHPRYDPIDLSEGSTKPYNLSEHNQFSNNTKRFGMKSGHSYRPT